uniref:reverse transcriptase domain-containing protein n=1 Tax=Ramaria cf. rubripermanens TaxID=2016387 RepID=UPI002238C465
APYEGPLLAGTLSNSSCIFDRYTHDACCGYSRLYELISQRGRVAEYKCNGCSGLPRKENIISRNSHVEANEPDTYKRFQDTDNILSRICRYYSRIAWWDGTNSPSCQKSRRSPQIGSSFKCKQATNTMQTLNTAVGQLRDLTASVEINNSTLRKRSFHSSIQSYTKGSSINSPSFETLDSNNKNPVSEVKPKKVAKRVGVTTIVKGKLEQLKKSEQKYYKLLNIITDPYFLVACYEDISKKKGNMTPGSDGYTLDGLKWEWFVETADMLKKGTFNFKPSRRIEIPKSDGRTRPLGIGSPRDKIVQKALHAILEAIYEPLFLPCSHGYRPNRSVHSALLRVYLTGDKYNWVIQGDITKCFDSIPHIIIMKRIRKLIGDPRILELILKYLKAGYLDSISKNVITSDIGTPQGGILSPILCNIVLHEFDKYMANYEIKFKKGLKRKINPIYKSLAVERSKSNSVTERWTLLKKMREVRRTLQTDPDFRRMEYIRYADDFLVLVTGTLKETESIKSNIKDLLKTNCGLELNQDKSVITNLTSSKWTFLGAEMKKLKTNPEWRVKHTYGEAVGIPKLLVNAPIPKWITELKKGGFTRQNQLGKILPQAYTKIVNLSHYEILQFFNSKIHGVLNFYSFASNRSSLYTITWLLKASCALTLARKFKLGSLRKVFQKFGSSLKCPETDLELQSPASLKAIHEFKVNDRIVTPSKIINQSWGGKLTKSSFDQVCAICGTSDNIEMHHIRSVKGIRVKYIKGGKTSFAQFEGAIKRKQTPLCTYHHYLYHKGELNYQDLKSIANHK